MSEKNILFIISTFLIMFVMESGLYAGRKNKEIDIVIEECGFSTFVRKCLSCFIKKSTFEDEDEEFLLEQDGFSFTSGILVERNLNTIPVEVFWKICYKLSPLHIVQLSLTSKNFLVKINEDFWKSYLRVHGQEKWDKSAAAIRTACAFSLFEEKKIRRAAELGLPKAIEIVKREENEAEAKKWESSPYSSKKSLYDSYEYGKSYYPPFLITFK